MKVWGAVRSTRCIRIRKQRGIIKYVDSTRESDNNCTMLQHNRGIIAVKSDEDKERTEYTCIIPKQKRMMI